MPASEISYSAYVGEGRDRHIDLMFTPQALLKTRTIKTFCFAKYFLGRLGGTLAKDELLSKVTHLVSDSCVPTSAVNAPLTN